MFVPDAHFIICEPFAADGYGRSEAVVSILLQKRRSAKRLYASILSIGTNTDGFKPEGITYPSVSSQVSLMSEVQSASSIHPHDMKYIEAHMTGTPAGDVVESESILKTFCTGRKDPLLLGCLKSNLGHTEGASGTCSLSKVCLAMERGELPPNLHFENPNPNIEGLSSGQLKPVLERMAFDEDVVGVSSFGFGGCNVYTVLKRNMTETTEDSYVHAFDSGVNRIVCVSGRSREGVQYVLDYIVENQEKVTNEFLALLDDSMKLSEGNEGRDWRGYAVFSSRKQQSTLTNNLSNTSSKPLSPSKPISIISQSICHAAPSPAPVYLAISGLCNKWTTLPDSLLDINSFSRSIRLSSSVALNMGLDLHNILFERQPHEALKLSEAMVGIAATQIALIDLLNDLNVKIDGYIGHSIGEIVCAYADNCLSREQTLWTSYLIAKQLMSVSERNGMTGLEWEGIGVQTDKIKKLYPKLKEVLSEAVFREKGKKRSGKWISSMDSSKECLMDSYLSSGYFASVMTSACNFKKQLYLIPKNAVVLEVAAQGILENVLRKGLGPDVEIKGMLELNKTAPNTVHHLLSVLGCLYCHSINASLKNLYPAVEYPVPRGTMSISPLIKWNHKKALTVTKFPSYFAVIRGVHSYDLDLMQSSFQYLSGHVIDGRNLCPAVEYLRYVWEVVVANLSGDRDYMKYAIEFRKVRLVRGIMLSKHKAVQVVVKYQKETGAFETSEGGNLCCTGFAYLAKDADTELVEKQVQDVVNSKTGKVMLDNKSVYKELRVRGYDYGHSFQGLTEASCDGSHGKVKWMGQWVSFVDSMLQIAIMGQKERSLRIPTYLEYFKCNASAFFANIERSKDEMGDSVVDVYYDDNVGVGCSAGILIQGLKTTVIPRRNAQEAVLEGYGFVPYKEQEALLDETTLDTILGYREKCMRMLDVLRKQLVTDEDKLFIQEVDKIVVSGNNHCVLKALFETEKELEKQREDNESMENHKSVQEILEDKLTSLKHLFSNDILSQASLEDDRLIRHQIDLIIENTNGKNMKILEMNSCTSLFAEKITDILDANLIQSQYTVMHSESAASLISKGSEVNLIDFNKMKDKTQLPSDLTDLDVIVLRDESCQMHPLGQQDTKDMPSSMLPLDKLFEEAMKCLKPNAFFFMCFKTEEEEDEEVERSIQRMLNKKRYTNEISCHSQVIAAAEEKGLQLICLKKESALKTTALLFRKPMDLNDFKIQVIPITNLNYDWIEEIKAVLLSDSSQDEETNKKLEQEKRKELQKTRLYLTSNEDTSGIVGLINCLRREPGSDCVRCLLDSSREDKITEIPEDVLKNDLVMNIFEGDSLGSNRHSILNNEDKKVLTSHAFVDMKTKGDLSSFRWLTNNTKFFDETPSHLKDTESSQLIRVSYSALNFKDVMIASGRISTDAYPAGMGVTGCLLGMEFSGYDCNGNRVMGYTIGKGMATEVSVLHPLFLWPVPGDWTLSEAATVPVVYATVYYGMLIRGKLLRGESVLIHSGAGGVGQAAINVCQSMGCRIFTTCSESKRQFLKDKFHLQDTQIFNSRDTSFEEEILKATNGRGVDVVLNSLSESKLKASVNCLADFGRFVEIGKYDIMVDNLMDMAVFETNKTLEVTCLAHLDVDAFFNQNQAAIKTRLEVYKLLKKGIEEGVVKPLERHVYEKENIEEAFRFMGSGKHIGKVLIKVDDDADDSHSSNNQGICSPPKILATQQTLFHPNKSYIITGGLGGFGLELSQWMVSRGAKNLILVSRKGIKDNYQSVFLERLKSESVGVSITISTDDTTTESGVIDLLNSAEKTCPVGGIFNLSMVLADATLAKQNASSFSSCCDPKVAATLLLDRHSRILCTSLDYFVMFSSIVSGRGNAGQTNYGYANSVMERVCESRRRLNLPALAIQWGAIGDVGVVAEVLGGNDVVIGGTCVPQRLVSCLETLDVFLSGTDHYSTLSSIVRVNCKKNNSSAKGDLVSIVCHILGIKDPSTLDPSSTLSDLGMDSLIAIEIKQGLEREFDLCFTTQEIRNMRIKDLREMEKTVGNKKKSSGNQQSVHESSTISAREITCLERGNFQRLNEVDAGKGIFVFPSFEGSFRLLTPIFKHVNRPVIALNWTEEVEAMRGSFKDIVAYFVHLIERNYPDTQYDLVGFDFGGLIATEAAAQLQNQSKTCDKLCLLESSPELMKGYASSFLKTDQGHVLYNNLLVEYLNMFFPLENTEKQDLQRELQGYDENKEEKLKFVAQVIDKKIGEEAKNNHNTSGEEQDNPCCDPVLLGQAIDRFHKKLKLASAFSLSRDKLSTEILLQRSTDSFNIASQLDSSYNLSKVCFSLVLLRYTNDKLFVSFQIQDETHKRLHVEVLEGDHRSMLEFHAEAIGNSIDSFFVNLVCA